MSTTTDTATQFATSADGTPIAYERIGAGPAVVIVDGALCSREMGPSRAVAEHLAEHYTVYIYDRRGRGESGDTATVTPEREVEDLEAVITAAGEPVRIVGFSSGCALVLATIQHSANIAKAALYEFPMIIDDSRPPAPETYLDDQRASIAAGKPGEAIKRFMRLVGMPAPLVALFPLFPGWSKTKRAGHTLVNDALLIGDTQSGKPIPEGRYADVTLPTVVYAGGKSPAWLRNANAALAEAIPGSEHRILAGQTHMVKAPALAPELVDFFG